MEINQKIIVASKNVSKIITSLLLAFIMCASNPLLSSSDDEREARDEGIFGLIDGGLGFDMMEERSIDASFGFVSGEDSEAGVHSDVREVSCASAEQFSRKRKRAEGDERRAKRVPAPDQSTAAHVLSLPDLSVDLAPLEPFLLPYQDLDPALLLSLPLPCPDLNPVELQSDDKAVASEAVDVVSGKRKPGNAGSAIKVRDAEKPFECVYEGCGYATGDKRSLKLHMRTHTGEKPFECGHKGCDFRTAYVGNLKKHEISKHTGEKLFECGHEGCGYASARKYSLKIHMRTHTGEKPFVCDFWGCTYATAESGRVKTHMRMHTGEKPFVCDFPRCTYAAGQSESLKIHKKKHTGEKLFECDFEGCSYTSTQASGIKRHRKMHVGVYTA